MGTSARTRRGFTLVELLVVIGIFALMVGLVLAAIQKVRESASLLQNKNNLRQIILAMHQVAGANEGKIENLTRSSMKGVNEADHDSSLFTRLTPYVHGPKVVPTDLSTAAWNDHLTLQRYSEGSRRNSSPLLCVSGIYTSPVGEAGVRRTSPPNPLP